MCGQVAVPKIEPAFTAERSQALESGKRFVLKSPTCFWIHHTGKSVGDDVEIGRNPQTVKNHVVASIYDDREIVRVDHLHEPGKQLRRSDAAGKCGDVHQ